VGRPPHAAESALEVAERVRAAIAAHHFAVADGPHLTCSIDVATYPADGQDRGSLVDSADRAMYAAKRLGRTQALLATDPAVTALHAGSRDESREHQALLGAVDALAMLVDVRDRYTGMHGAEVGSLSHQMAVALRCDQHQVGLISLGARLHDVGKVAIPDAIPLGARIVAAADSFAAMTSKRPYSEPRNTDAAVAELRRCAGSQFDPRIVDALVTIVTQEVLAARRAA
jgi:response regulator RpfG family c-di-GMP phosphodiesterase